ncbi:glycosyltransferase [Morganella morganii]|uniref:glycosyltransferase n=1 Tax=Morganella morganii TaxID=582 RepID=UPI0021CE052C|nr:glycosyltransferase family 4 protein [Morganella morganii]MCU6375769.1 glycosyltransferase family 4 protein [Morganella morganii]HEI9845845.1 glycosyltransferase family 4 protein [Morganella morganii]
MSDKILYISPYLDTDTSFGGSIVSWSNLSKLNDSTFDIVSIAISRTYNNKVNYSINSSKNKFHTALYNLIGVSGRLSFSSINRIKKIIEKENPKLIYLDSSYLGKLAKIIKINYPTVKIITFFHNIEYDFEINRIKKNQYQYIPSLWSAWLNERKAIKYSDQLFMLHDTDSNRALKLYKRSADFLLPVTLPSSSGLDIQYQLNNSSKFNFIGFLGTAFYANIEAAKYISNYIAPLLPEYNFIIAGKGFEKLKSEIHGDNISILGSIDSISEFYNKIDIFIAPIFTGGGMKVKISEALSYNKPIIASSFALIGYEKVIDNLNVFIANSPNEFIEKIQNFRFINNPRELFINNFSNESVSVSLINQIKKLYTE